MKQVQRGKNAGGGVKGKKIPMKKNGKACGYLMKVRG